MCGIAGLLNITHRARAPLRPALLTAMADSMKHRGPDGSGVWVNEDAYLGMSHRRLSIIDLSNAAAQPMHDVSNELTIVYNGEIYNHAELRQQLTNLGHRNWQTDHSDTEVLLAAYKERGVD